MELELENQPVNDAEAVKAVRDGNVDRYRELVERHERRVFAVAWSRLGDAALAEEATQEAFIKGFKQLWSLGDGKKFSSWIATIARHAAINLGLRNRRELNKRARWALEQVPDTDSTAEVCTPETLRRVMEDLPPAHRECLVLFYLENKSGTEAATALGISESAFRVRLHRARAVLREQLELQLESSLEKLRPTKSVAPIVMAGISSSSLKLTTSGLGATLAKLGLGKWLAPAASFFSILFVLPMVAFGWLLMRLELKNFRDQKGFRAQMFRAGIKRRFAIAILAGAIAAVILPLALRHLHLPLVTGGAPNRTFFLLFGLFFAVFVPFLLRQLAINRNPYFVAQFCSGLGVGAFCLLVGLGFLSQTSLVLWIIVAQAFVTLPFLGHRPNRMDYNLFLRASEGLLPNQATPSSTPADKEQCLLFACFLGSRWLINRHRWTADGLLLRLPVVGSSPWWEWTDWTYNLSWNKRSRILLQWDGTIRATLADRDAVAVRKISASTDISKTALEEKVSLTAGAAWEDFRRGNSQAAEQKLGQQADAEIFVNPPAKGGMAKPTRLITVIAIIVIALTQCGPRIPFIGQWLNRLTPVRLSEEQVRDFINQPWPHDLKHDRAFDALLGYYSTLVAPPTNLFSPEALREMRDEIVGDETFEKWKNNPWRIQHVFDWPTLRHAMAVGWISWTDLGVTPSQAGAFLRTNALHSGSTPWEYLLAQCQAWSWVSQQKFTVDRIQWDGVTMLRLLQSVDCLDLVDRKKLIDQISSAQILSGNPPGQPPMHDWRDVRGLFFTPCFPALEDTYCSLAALQILGGLNQIDREACIEGILRLHRGKGYFVSPNSGGFNEYHICGDWRDTYSALESLRILGALDRVQDLRDWQFRLWGPARNEKRTIDWYEVDAWVCKDRFEREFKK